MADSKKTENVDFEKDLAPVYTMGVQGRNMSMTVHRRNESNYTSRCGCINYYGYLDENYKNGTQYSNICKECLKSYSMEEIKQLKHFLIVQKLKGK